MIDCQPKVLIIDDHPSDILLLVLKLEREGFLVQVGLLQQYYNEILSGPLEFDAFLTDLTMPELGKFKAISMFNQRIGYSVALAARKHFQGAVGILTGALYDEDGVGEMLENNSIAFLGKHNHSAVVNFLSPLNWPDS